MGEFVSSCRVTSALFAYVTAPERDEMARIGEELGFSRDYLCDPINWVEPEVVAILFHRLEKRRKDPMLSEKVGVAAPELNCWGPFDGVLRFVGKPSHLFEQAEKVARYFFRSGRATVEECGPELATLQFDMATLMPHEAGFLTGLFAGLPQYWGMQAAEFKHLEEGRIRFSWGKELRLFHAEEIQTGLSPKLAGQVLAHLAHQERELAKTSGRSRLNKRSFEQILGITKELLAKPHFSNEEGETEIYLGLRRIEALAVQCLCEQEGKEKSELAQLELELKT